MEARSFKSLKSFALSGFAQFFVQAEKNDASRVIRAQPGRGKLNGISWPEPVNLLEMKRGIEGVLIERNQGGPFPEIDAKKPGMVRFTRVQRPLRNSPLNSGLKFERRYDRGVGRRTALPLDKRPEFSAVFSMIKKAKSAEVSQ